ncbi:MAG: methyltransferase [Bacteroidota bacterium]
MATLFNVLNTRSITKKIYVSLFYPFIAAYIKKERPFTHKGLRLRIMPGVFHPGFYFSTKFFFSFIDTLPLANKKCLEIGCGSGLLSLLMLRKRGDVTAIDINPNAIQNTALNYKKNKSQFDAALKLIQSDLLDQVRPTQFDFVVIAPPYFFDEVTNDAEYAWYCGKNGEYFKKLFSQIGSYIHPDTKVYMILADNCDISRIEKLGQAQMFYFELISTKRIWWEDNYIYQVIKR